MQAPLQTRNDADAVQTETATTSRQERRVVDKLPAAVAQRELTEMLNRSPRVLQQRALSDAIHNSPRMVAQRHELNALFGGAVRPQGDGAMPAELSSAQREEKTNNTGLPNQLKSGMESLSGMSMDHIKVHYNSAKPAQLQAHAYAQGSEIHLGAGQERHLPHEAWHVVQQAQGRVRPTLQMKAGAVNDDPSLEKEADMMGEKAAQFEGGHSARNLVAEEGVTGKVSQRGAGFVAQRQVAQLARQTIVQHGEMSGDQFQIAVALKLDPELRLILIGENMKNEQDKSAGMYDFYVNQSGIDPARIHYYRVDGNMATEVKNILHQQHEMVFDQETASVGQATNIVKEKFNEKDHTPEIRDTWMATSGYTESDFGKLVRDFNIPLDSPMLVMWSRQSGALGGLHPEHDSSHTAMEQMMERFAAAGYALVIAGDDPSDKIGGMKGALRFSKTVRLGQLWEKRGLWKKNRTAQFAFFEYLRREVPSLTHVGMRSGNLEAYAYMGHRVIYLEEKGRSDSLRMDKISTDPSLKLNYRTVKLDSLPTATGQLMRDASRLANSIADKVIPGLSRRYPAMLSALRLDVLDQELRKVRMSSLPLYQKEMHWSRLLKNWVASVASRGLSVESLLGENKVNSKDPIAVKLMEVVTTISTLRKGFTPTDLDKIVDAVIDFSSHISEKPEADPEEMDFGDYESDAFDHDPTTMFWRNLDRRIKLAGEDVSALTGILLSLTPERRQKLRDNYQQDLDLMLGYGGRVTPKIQRQVIRMIDMLRTHARELLMHYSVDKGFPDGGSPGGSGMPGWGLAF
ncbi:DUF4157 domain-containing protein [Massilia sp. DJPM01]|uniref:eCIS core domain-containing protein n=1 Tax=Massilia sp. DJPM01 TaxID=3024404 RepID=UPI00259DBBF4|nr:DUF4157 domain-containing protein [Massilia sp. DJPM01]MDM5179162.1 DUF4157 domain-containing protein [Massilia sp. DJPM01]